MKRMICYFLLCALVLICIAGCISKPPASSTPADATAEPSGSQAVQGTQGDHTTQPSNRETEPQQTVPGVRIPPCELEPLPTVDREKTGLPVEYDPERELYILISTNDIIYPMSWSVCSFSFRIFSKKPLDVNSISVKVPISQPYTVSVREHQQGGIEDVYNNNRMNEHLYGSRNPFTYPMYLTYLGKDFREMAQLESNYNQVRAWQSHYLERYFGTLTTEEYAMLEQPYAEAMQAYEDSINADLENYLALTKEDLPQFYVYGVNIIFDYLTDFVQDESFNQIEITIGDQIFVRDVGNVSLITDWELPAPIDWGELDGTIGGNVSLIPYNDGVGYVGSYFHFTADCYKLLEELVMLNPALKVERVWLQIDPKAGKPFVEEWDMSEPYEIFPGDRVAVYVAISDPAMDTPGYQNMIDAYLLYSADGEQYVKFSNCEIGYAGSDYFWNAVLFDGIDMEDYYWEYYYRMEEAWRFDPEELPGV